MGKIELKYVAKFLNKNIGSSNCMLIELTMQVIEAVFWKFFIHILKKNPGVIQ